MGIIKKRPDGVIKTESFRLAFIADIHLYSSFLGVSGRAYELRSGSDQKCLAESGAVTDAAFDAIKKSGSNAAVIVGDLTNDGEKCSHAEIMQKLEALNESVPVYAVTSTHDWCSDGNARRYAGSEVFTDVETASRDELNSLYGGFGKANEISSFKTTAGFLSRSFRLSNGIRLILVNDDCDGIGGKSGYSDAHLKWVENEAREGAANGEFVIAAEHHLVLPCISRLVNSSQLISDGNEVAGRLADAGVRLLFVGHSHMLRATDFVSQNGSRLTQINLSALCGYPAGITYVTVKDGSAEIKTEYIEKLTYNGKDHGADFFRTHAENIVMHVLDGAKKSRGELSDRLHALGIKAQISDRSYGIIKKGVSFLTNVTVGKAAHTVNALMPFGGRIDIKALSGIKNDRLMKYVMPVFLSVFDGSQALDGCPDEVRGVLVTLANKISAYLRALPVGSAKRAKTGRLAADISQTLKELAHPRFTLDTEVFFNDT